MNKYISEFLKGVCHQIKYTKIHGDISKELLSHIDETKDQYMLDGMPEDEAAHMAVKQMGNPIEIGRDLNKTHKPRIEWSVIILIATMILIGAGTLLSIGAGTDSLGQSIKSYLIYALLGLAIFTIFFFFDYTKFEKHSLFIFIATIIFILILQLNGPTVNGHSSWIVIGSLNINAISLTIPFFLMSFSGLTAKWGTGNLKDVLKLLALAVFALLIYLSQPSLIDAMILGFGFLVILTIAFMKNNKNALFFVYGGGIVGALFILMRMAPYQLDRLRAFLNLSNDPGGSGYIYMTKEKVLAGAKLLGKGEAVEGSALTMINSDFIFIYIISNFGWIAGVILIAILLLVVIRMIIATGKIYSTYGKYIAISIVTVFALQILIHVAMNLRLFPIMGVSLPLISYGGTDFITNMALIGLFLGVYRRKDLIILHN